MLSILKELLKYKPLIEIYGSLKIRKKELHIIFWNNNSTKHLSRPKYLNTQLLSPSGSCEDKSLFTAGQMICGHGSIFWRLFHLC